MNTAISNDHLARGTSRGILWFGMLGGAFAWLLHLMLAYVTAEFGCVGQLGDRIYAGMSVVGWMQLGLTAATTVMAGAATFAAYRCLGHERDVHERSETPEQYTARAGVMTSGLFVLVILFESIPIFYYLRNC